MISPIRHFRKKIKEYNLDAYLITKDVDIRYLTCFPAAESWLLITSKSAVYITDFRYAQEARNALKGVRVHQYKKSMIQAFLENVQKAKVKKVGFDARHMSVALFQKMTDVCPRGVKLVAKNSVVDGLREVKTEREIDRIRQSIKLNLEAFKYLKRVIKPGITEKEILFRLERYVKTRGALFSFDPIIASGVNSSFPHAKVTDRKVRNNEPVLVDMGIDINGYKSDLTRMFFLGKIPPHVRGVADAVRVAQKRAIETIKVGVKASDVDYQARKHLKKNKLDKYFGHALGHGVGLEIHEDPRISEKNPALLKEGMIVTVEPAVYIPNQFGVRIEDMALVTSDGCEVLSST